MRPDGITGRIVLVLLVGLLLSHLAALFLYSGNRIDTLTRLGSRQAAERIAAVVAVVEEAVPAERTRLLRASQTPGLLVRWGELPAVAGDDQDEPAAALAETLRRQLAGRELRAEIGPMPPRPMLRRLEEGEPRVEIGPIAPRPPEAMPPRHPGPWNFDRGMHRYMHGAPFGEVARVSVRLADGSWLNFAAPLDLADSLWRPRFALSLLLMAVAVTLLSIWAVRRATRPLRLFATAAERLGVDVGAPPMAEAGPREVRRAARAFNDMQTRLRRFIEDRTQMLAAISHDLRTPLTRLRLRAEFVEDETERDKMLADLAEMEAMIAATLAFGRDDVTREPRRAIDLAELLRGLVGDAVAAGRDAAYDGPDALAMAGRPGALKRAFANLIDNAVTYGARARVRLVAEPSQAVVQIDDDGPGIPAPERERVFAPFYRIEGSRSRDTGGTGLGLAVARSAVRAHGGDILLADRPEGGLRTTVILPLQS